MDDDKKNKIVELFKSSATPARDGFSINIHAGDGDGNGIGNTIIKTEKVIHRPRIEVKTGDGVITAEQKARLQQLVKDWLSARNAVRKTAMNHATAWSSVNKKAGVNSYHEIPADKFKAVEKWLLQQIAIVNAMPSAKAKSTSWRAGRIKSIQARCNELGVQDKRKAYMIKTFGQDSLTMLSDADVEKIYRWAMAQ